jgi:hypothetical protein
MTEGLYLPQSGQVMTTSAPDTLTRDQSVTVHADTKSIIVACGETRRRRVLLCGVEGGHGGGGDDVQLWWGN